MRWLGVVAALVALAVPARADVAITISKSQQRMSVSVDGGQPSIWTVSTGRDGYTTPSGGFRAIRLEEVYYSKKYDDAPMPNAVFFYGGYAIHGTMEESKLGRPVSHGCVRLARSNAVQLFALVRAHGMSRTHITITDAPLSYGVPMARGYQRDDGRYERSLAARSAPERYAAPARSAEPVRYTEPGRSAYRGFEQFGNRDQRYAEPQRRVQWRDEPRPRDRGMVVSGRTYSEAEFRRLMRDGGWR